jgi:hypothetical protein
MFSTKKHIYSKEKIQLLVSIGIKRCPGNTKSFGQSQGDNYEELNYQKMRPINV